MMNMIGIETVSRAIRGLSMDAIQKANSGHPGLPLGAAELAAVLYGEILKHNPENPHWANRDRFVLSAGHGSMLLYSVLHLSGYSISLDDIKQFRQLGSKCPGHPEYGVTAGVEASTGPLGQGVSMAVGMAIAETMLANRFNTSDFTVVDHYTYALVGEGCLMEGVSSEAASFAGHLKLNKLIVFYDENRISIDGETDCTFTEDIAKRYEAYDWNVFSCSMYEPTKILEAVEEAKKLGKPSLIMLRSVIGKGAPSVAGSSKAHGAPIGEEGVAEAKKVLGLPEEPFYVDSKAYDYFTEKKLFFAQTEKDWILKFDDWSKKYPEKRQDWDSCFADENALWGNEKNIFEANVLREKRLVAIKNAYPVYKTGEMIATRSASGKILQVVADSFNNLVGGSADLEGSNETAIKNASVYTSENRGGRRLRFGIRELNMAGVCAGILLHGGLKSFCSTFLVFADYMRPAIRLASIMKIPTLYVLTHDSIFVGEDGPTHQPVETIESLRIIPGVQVLRPADGEETSVAWSLACESTNHPVCLILSRQKLPVFEKDDPNWQETMRCGAYIVRRGGDNPDVTIIATGSEVAMALEASSKVTEKSVRIVSMPDRGLFDSQPDVIKTAILGNSKRTIVVEAGISSGWKGFVADENDLFTINRFGESAPASKVAESFGFTAEKLAEYINTVQ